MVQFDFYLIIIKDLIRKKFSTALTVFAISLGILSIFVILSITQSFNDSIESQVSELGGDIMTIQASQGSEVSFDDSTIRDLERNSNIESIYGVVNERIQIQNGREFRSVSIISSKLNDQYFEDNNYEIEFGTAPNIRSKYDIVIGSEIAQERFRNELRVGSRLTFNSINFRVVGITKSSGDPQRDSTIFMQYDALQEFGLVDNYESLSVILRDSQDLDFTKEQIELYFENEIGEDRVSIITAKDTLEQLNTITGLITGVLGGIGFVSLIVGALGIINTMFVIVQEKIKDIGILKSVGARNREILQLFMFQSSLFGILGAIFGIIIGILSLFAIQFTLNSLGFTFLEIELYPLVMLQMLLFGSLVGAIAGFIPSFIASRIDVVEALRK